MTRHDWTTLAVIGLSGFAGMSLTSALLSRTGVIESRERVRVEPVREVVVLRETDGKPPFVQRVPLERTTIHLPDEKPALRYQSLDGEAKVLPLSKKGAVKLLPLSQNLLSYDFTTGINPRYRLPFERLPMVDTKIRLKPHRHSPLHRSRRHR